MIELHAAGIVIGRCFLVVAVGDTGVDIADVDRHILAEIGQRHGGRDATVAGDNDAQRLHVAEPRRRHQHAQLLAVLEPAVERRRADHGDDRLDLVGRGAEFAQDGADRLALLDDDLPLAPVAAAVDDARGLGQQRDVLRHDARHETEISVGIGLRRVAHFQVRRAVGIDQQARRRAGWRWRRRRARAPAHRRAAIASTAFTLGNSELRSQTAGRRDFVLG